MEKISWTDRVRSKEVLHTAKGEKNIMYTVNRKKVGRDGSVGIATGYGLDGPRIDSRWGRDFPHLFRPALGPT